MRRLKFLLLFAWTLILFAATWFYFPLPVTGMGAVSHSVFAAGALLFVALSLGRALLRRFRLFHGSLVEEAGFSLALGLAAFSLAASALGALGVLYAWVAWSLVLAVGVASWGHSSAFADALRRSVRAKHPWEGSTTEVATVLCLCLGLLTVGIMVAAPPKFFDALVYHFADAQRAAFSGRIAPRPGMFFSWLPSLAGPLWSLALVLDGSPMTNALAPSLLNFAVYLALGLMVMDASARILNDRRIWLAPALVLTQPLLLLSFGDFSPDGWGAFYAFLSLDAFLLALGDRVQRSQAAWLLLSAGLAGAAVASKPVNLIHALALALLVATLAYRDASWRRPGLLLAGLGIFVVPLLPWLLQGSLRLGEPFYPFPVHVLGLELGKGGPASYYQHMADFGGRGFLDFVRLPYTLFFDSNALGGGGHPGFLILALAPAALVWRLDRALQWTLFYLLLGLAAWTLGPHVLRYGLCLMPAAFLLVTHGVLEAETWAVSKTWTYLWRGLVLAGLFSTALESLVISVKSFDPMPVAFGLETPENYLARMEVPQALAAQWILGTKVQDPGVLVLGDERSAYLPPRSLACSVFEQHPLAGWVAQARNPEEVGAIAHAKGYDFVFFNGAEWARLQREGTAPIYWPAGDNAAQVRFFAWLDRLRALPEKDRYSAGDLMVARLR